MPNVDVPQVHVPNVHVPNVRVQHVHVPNVHVPNVQVPNVQVPNAHERRASEASSVCQLFNFSSVTPFIPARELITVSELLFRYSTDPSARANYNY